MFTACVWLIYSQADIPLGELTVAISYAQDTRILSVIIRNAKHLPKIKAGKAPGRHAVCFISTLAIFPSAYICLFKFFTERLVQVAPVWLVLKFIDNMAMVHLAYNYVEENKFIDRRAGFHYNLCDCRIFPSALH